MNTYLIVYNVHYNEKSCPEDNIQEMIDNVKQTKKLNDRELSKAIYSIAQKYRQYWIWHHTLSENLIIKCDLKGEELLKFIDEKIKAKWICDEKQYLDIGIENIINLDQV